MGLSANNILGALTDMGIGVARSTGLRLVRAARSSLQAGALQQSLKPATYPEVTDFTAAQYYTSKRFTYTIEHSVTYEETGATGTEFMSISSDTLLSNNDLSEAVDNIMAVSATDYAFTINSSKVSSVLVDPRFLP